MTLQTTESRVPNTESRVPNTESRVRYVDVRVRYVDVRVRYVARGEVSDSEAGPVAAGGVGGH